LSTKKVTLSAFFKEIALLLRSGFVNLVERARLWKLVDNLFYLPLGKLVFNIEKKPNVDNFGCKKR